MMMRKFNDLIPRFSLKFFTVKRIFNLIYAVHVDDNKNNNNIKNQECISKLLYHIMKREQLS